VSEQPARRFLKLEEVADLFSTSVAQVYALVRRGDLRAIKLGGRGQWRVEKAEIEAYIQRAYAETDRYLGSHPSTDPAQDAGTPADPPEPPTEGIDSP
jgi:excisionase family DNA binding protein